MSAVESETAAPGRGWRSSLRRLARQLRTEGEGPGATAAAVALGLMIGTSPFYGFHLALSWLLGRLTGLNRLKVYVAANISNPVFAPFLILTELQAGAWLQRGDLHALSIAALRGTDPWTFGTDILAGWAVVGPTLAVVGGTLTYVLLRRPAPTDPWRALVDEAAERYVGDSITAWEFARGKLRGDPVYRQVLLGNLLPSRGRLMDVGCGQGLMIAVLLAAQRAARDGEWPIAWPAPARFDDVLGVELRPRVARLARRALGDAATVLEADICQVPPPVCSAILCFDVLHMIPAAAQDTLLQTLRRALDAQGVLLVREADRGSGLGFVVVRIVNRAKALLQGQWGQRFAFRSRADWQARFEAAGFATRIVEPGTGAPLGNVLFCLTVPPPAADTSGPVPAPS